MYEAKGSQMAYNGRNFKIITQQWLTPLRRINRNNKLSGKPGNNRKGLHNTSQDEQLPF